ncbi:membrane protein, putative [Oceanicola granulosus HTCC2516]|uniref:Membrane protein, putative n=1 Tax=Oceanicola granulosus (strain ATCC BAA-861 / DSM 15982 / KCTC 12143 / HTCC2516) TaxID=314256 RepID=Q2CFJ9_OCEGH|nr:EI24 domain-containing protein [Oceanicola granulosus]EAR51483.1 membrane protein, putative [Oceanicola granulosus HTCC2516]
MIFADFARALGQMSDRRFRRVLLLGIGLTLALLVLVYGLLLWFLDSVSPDGLELPLVGYVTWVGDFFHFGSILLMLLLSVVLMVPVASAITSLFLDDVAQAVEDRHYPHLPPVPRTGFGDAARDTVNFLGVIVGANFLAIFAYILFPFAAPLIFYGLNGYLLGREYFQIAAMRREGRKGARALYRKNVGQVWLAGLLMALPLTVPLVNLLVPILGAATFTHLYHRVSRR